MTLFTRTMSLDMISKLWDIIFIVNISEEVIIQVCFLLLRVVKTKFDEGNQILSIQNILKNLKLTDPEAYTLLQQLKHSLRIG